MTCVSHQEARRRPSKARITRHETRPFPPFPAISHDFPAPLPPRRCLRAVLGRTRGERRSLPLLSPSGLLPPRLTHHEPMFRKENVLDCVDMSQGITTSDPTGARSNHRLPPNARCRSKRCVSFPLVGYVRPRLPSCAMRRMRFMPETQGTMPRKLLSLSQGGALRRCSGDLIPVRAARPARARRSAAVQFPDGRCKLA